MTEPDDMEKGGKKPEHRQVMEAFDKAWEADRLNREDALSDLKFVAGDQWPDDVRKAREAQGRPVITINRMPQFLHQVTGDMRQSRPAIKVSPVDDQGDPDIAKIYNGIVRQVERISKADMVYTKAFEGSAACGIGHFRISTEYAKDSVSDQDIKIKLIQNPLGVLWDPNSKELDRSDAKHCFVIDGMTESAYKARWPKAAVSPVGVTDDQYNTGLFWAGSDMVRVAEYWYKVPKKRTIALMETGETIDLGDVKEDLHQFLPIAVRPDGTKATREVDCFDVEMCIVSGSTILEGPYKFPVPHIPIIPVIGEEVVIGDRVVRSGLIRHAKDPQRLYNYWRSSAAELIALAPKAPWMVTQAMIAKNKGMWDRANVSPTPYLIYETDPSAPGGMPQRVMPPAPPQALWQEAQIASDDMKATTGIYDAGLGAKSNETSGKAILARQREGDTSTYHLMDNLSHAIRRAGEIICALIPKIYDTQRVVRLLNEDGSEDWQKVNQQIMAADGAPIVLNDLSVGKYDVTVSTGPSYNTQRIESANAMVEFARAYPNAAPAMLDKIAKMMDWPEHEIISARLKAMLPPQLQVLFDMIDESGGDSQKMAEMMQQQQGQPDPAAELKANELVSKIEKTKAETQGIDLDNQLKAMQTGLALPQAEQPMAPEMQPDPGMQSPQPAFG
jgi:hypothetical protein